MSDTELARLRRELEYARAFLARLPLAERELLRRAEAAEIRLGYVPPAKLVTGG